MLKSEYQLISAHVLRRLGVVADVGQTLNSSVTYQHLVASKPDVSNFCQAMLTAAMPYTLLFICRHAKNL